MGKKLSHRTLPIYWMTVGLWNMGAVRYMSCGVEVLRYCNVAASMRSAR